MSVATINPTTTSRTSTDIDAVKQAAAGGGDFFTTTGVELLYIENLGGAPITLTITPGKTFDGQSVAAKTYTITNGTHHYLIGPFNPTPWADSTNNVVLTYSAVTSVNVAVIKPGSP